MSLWCSGCTRDFYSLSAGSNPAEDFVNT
ncbi:hypothetical protein PI27_gp018 [Listeria phage WIL-1]|nr:hypothetical protein PI27_gp018 [Listeria phage WIL-1]